MLGSVDDPNSEFSHLSYWYDCRKYKRLASWRSGSVTKFRIHYRGKQMEARRYFDHKTLLLCTLSYLIFFLSNYSLIPLSVFSSSLFTSYPGRGVKYKGPQGIEESKRPFIVCDRGNRISRIYFATRNCYITVSNRLTV
jgi:hypothetical protein